MATAPSTDMEAVKRLLMLLLLKLGSTSDEIAAALGVDSSVVRRTVPSRKVRKIEGLR
jgi:hypothetical protein